LATNPVSRFGERIERIVHHHPTLWPDPGRFDPHRFAPEQAAGRHKLAWSPFGAGQRQCIGRDFAIMEAQISLAMIVQHYTLAAPTPASLRPKFATTLRPQEAVCVQLGRR
jgi:cytochrome P450